MVHVASRLAVLDKAVTSTRAGDACLGTMIPIGRLGVFFSMYLEYASTGGVAFRRRRRRVTPAGQRPTVVREALGEELSHLTALPPRPAA